MFQMMKLPLLAQELILKRNKSCCCQGFFDILPELRKNFLVSTCCKFPTISKSTCDVWWFLFCGLSSCVLPSVPAAWWAGWSSLGGGVSFFLSSSRLGYFEGNLGLAHFSLCMLTRLKGGVWIAWLPAFYL